MLSFSMIVFVVMAHNANSSLKKLTTVVVVVAVRSSFRGASQLTTAKRKSRTEDQHE
jgi:hypothetical protein